MSEEPSREGWRIVVHGRVQGVGFRAFTRNAARALSLGGWVRNRPDGTVELEVEGPAEAVQAFRRQVRQGPRFSRVDGLDGEPLGTPRGFVDFDIRFG